MAILHLPDGKEGQQQVPLRICIENVQLWHPFLAKGDTFEKW
jgi:hypothetical protein